jgi:hypothetical protein
MTFKLIHARYDRETGRAYVELRDGDEDGGEALAVAVFSYKHKGTLSKQELEDELVRKARHIFKRAASAT